jgi:hypothetical protein
MARIGYGPPPKPIPTFAEELANGRELTRQFRLEALGLSAEQIQQKTRPADRQAEQFKKTYGISIYEYEEMFFSQGGKCKICNEPEHNNKLLSVDHCHNSGKVRGLLCGSCNIGLGHFKDNTRRLQDAIEYLRNA